MNSLLIFFGICGLCMCLAAGAGAASTTTDKFVKAEMEESTTPVPTATLQDSSDNKCDTEWTEYKVQIIFINFSIYSENNLVRAIQNHKYQFNFIC